MTAFLSYDHRDSDAATNVHQRLQMLTINNMASNPLLFANRRYFIDTWIDSASIPLGSVWREEVLKGITACHVVVLVTCAAHYSPHVAEEMAIAEAQGKPIFPLYVDGLAALSQYGLGHLHGYRIPPGGLDKESQLEFERVMVKALDSLHLK